MEYFADLHIHSCLSPCGDDDMTPCNICGMARIKGLDIIAVTDHNTARNQTKKKNKPSFFGNQRVMNSDDEQTDEEDALLIGATDFSLHEATMRVLGFGGVPVPAHINRGSHGLLVNLGFMPEDYFYTTVEMWRLLPCDEKALRGRHVLHNSDAHYLGDIAEREHALRLNHRTVDDLLSWMRSRQTV